MSNAFSPSLPWSLPLTLDPGQRGADAERRRQARQWSSDELFGNQRCVEIRHGEQIYRLQVTALGKLILTK